MDSKNPSLFFEENDREAKQKAQLHVKTEGSMSVFFREKEEGKIPANGTKSPSASRNNTFQSPRESSRLRDKERKNYNDTDLELLDESLQSGDQDDFLKDEAAAINSDLSPYDLSPLERKELPQFAENPGAYLQVRNHILKVWQGNLNEYLTLADAEKAIQEKYKCFVKLAFAFLQRFGFINTGVISLEKREKVQHKERVIVVGAGMAGLATARQLYHFGYQVLLLEARERVGGRVNTDDSLGGFVDMGASIITGLEGNPLTTVCKQLKTKLHKLSYECPLYDTDGKSVTKEVDDKVEYTFNWCLDESSRRKNVLPPSLGDAVFQCLKDTSNPLAPQELRVFNWHIANLEYACASDLGNVSLHHWDQDDKYEWAGDHCLLREGYSSIARQLTRDINLKCGAIVENIQYGPSGVKVSTSDGTVHEAEYAVVTLPLGVLKDGQVSFSPPLPEWKTSSIEKLGFGLLNKVALCFPHVFWNDDLDYFGQTSDTSETRGEYYLFWNLHRCMGKPVLVALAAGKAAYEHEKQEDSELVRKVLHILSKQFKDVPQPTHYAVTRWASDRFSRGSYSYIAVGSTGDDYDSLAKSVADRLFFAGEATTREHPATAAGAYLSGLRTAGMLDKACRGEIRAQFDVNKLTEEWKKERGAANKRARAKRSRWTFEAESDSFRGRKAFKRIKKSKLNESYSWLFNTSYRIPKKKTSPTKATQDKEEKPKNSNMYKPQDFMKRALDLLPKRKVEEIIRSPNASSSPKSPAFNQPTASSPSTISPKPEIVRRSPPASQSSFRAASPSLLSQRPPLHTQHVQPKPAIHPQLGGNGQLSFPQVPQQEQMVWQVAPHPFVPHGYSAQPMSYFQKPPQMVVNNGMQPNGFTQHNPQFVGGHQGFGIHSAVQPMQIGRQAEVGDVKAFGNPFGVTVDQSHNFASVTSPNTPTTDTVRQFRDGVSSAVVKNLDKYMKEGKILTREDFKHLARKLTHVCLEKERKQGNKELTKDVKKKIAKFVDQFFANIDSSNPYHKSASS